MSSELSEKDMEEEKKLQDLLIRRFIMTLIVVGVVEFVLTTISDRFIMPIVAAEFFPDYEMTEAFSTLALGIYMASTVLAGLIGLGVRILPEPVRVPVTIFVNNVISSKENSFFTSDEGYIISQMPFKQKVMFDIAVIAMLILLAVPYIIAAIRFAVVTLGEFRKIGAMRMKARKDYEMKRNLMISDIAHDLRTPITTISGYAQALSDGLVKDEDIPTYLKAIRDKSVGMNDLIQLLFDYTKLDSEGFTLTKEKTDVCEAVRECAAALYTDAEAAGMEMDVNIPEKKIELEIDRVQFKRVINNLTVNAIRHNNKGNRIGIIIFEDAGKTYIAVADRGRVIDEDKAENIFDPFYMGDESRNSRGGSGLGLSVARKVTEMHGFKLRLIQGSSLKRYREFGGYTKAFVITA